MDNIFQTKSVYRRVLLYCRRRPESTAGTICKIFGERCSTANDIGFHDKGMLLAGGCGDTNGKPQIDKTDYLKKAYGFGKAIYNE